MNKVLVGLLVGAALGAVDGMTAWFTPQVRPQILEIVFFSTIKGIIAGVLAGWFARRVQSVPKGIAFGFAVGLLLAFAVAAMPDPNTGEHYWWQIMVPGSILGGVIGWSTQRYGRPGGRPARGAVATAAMAALLAALLLPGANAQADDTHKHAAPKGNAAFERLKSMAGTWKANTMTPDGAPTTVEYRVTASGTAVMETMFAGSEHEMINMYTVDGDAVTATHYCGGNQPFLRMNAEKSNDKALVFDFVKVAGNTANGYINGVTIRFGDDGKVVEEWSTSSEGPHMTLYLQGRK